jgi:hypothetical protein
MILVQSKLISLHILFLCFYTFGNFNNACITMTYFFVTKKEKTYEKLNYMHIDIALPFYSIN